MEALDWTQDFSSATFRALCENNKVSFDYWERRTALLVVDRASKDRKQHGGYALLQVPVAFCAGLESGDLHIIESSSVL